MSNYIHHVLTLKEGSDTILSDLIRKDNLITKRTIYRYNRSGEVEGREIDNVLDMNMCDKTLAYQDVDKTYMTMIDSACNKNYSDYDERVKKNEARGWEVDPTFEDGKHFRRKWDKRVYDSLALEPVMFEGNSAEWYRAWTWNDLPATAISKFYPELTFEYSEYSCGNIVCHCLMKNGETIKNLLKK